MKEKIIQILGLKYDSEITELKANQIMLLFNQRIVDVLKKRPIITDLAEFVNEIFIQIP